MLVFKFLIVGNFEFVFLYLRMGFVFIGVRGHIEEWVVGLGKPCGLETKRLRFLFLLGIATSYLNLFCLKIDVL